MGAFLITAESSIAAGTRRVEALVGDQAAERLGAQQRVLHELAHRMSRPVQDLVSGFEERLEQLKRAERERKALQLELARVRAGRLAAEGKSINGLTFVSARIEQADRELLTALADAVRGALTQDGLVLLVSQEGPAQVAWVMAATKTAAQRVHVGQVLKTVCAITQGSGGGRPDFAQGGGKDPSKIGEALSLAERLVREAVERKA